MHSDVHGSVKILIADDHPMLRQGIRETLERDPDFKVVGEASNGDEAVKLTNELKPDVVVMDIGMPRVGGLEATKRIKALHPHIAVLVLTVHDDEEYILGLLEAGATGYLLKSAYGEELVQTIRAVRTGNFVLDPIVGQRLLRRSSRNRVKSIMVEGPEHLTTKEIEVLNLLATGMSNQDIAVELGVKVRTVKGHLADIFAKMGVGSRTEAVLHAIKQGWIAVNDGVKEPGR